MVEPSQQWLLNPGPLQEALRPGTPYSDLPSTSDADHQTSSTALSRGKAGLAQSIVVLSSHSSQAMTGGCQCIDLTKEHAAAHAHALLSQLDPNAAEQSIAPDDIFHRLLALGEVIWPALEHPCRTVCPCCRCIVCKAKSACPALPWPDACSVQHKA